MAPLVEEVARDAAAAFGLTINTDCFYGHIPDNDQDPAAGFIGTGGPTERDDRSWDERTMQVKVRGSYGVAEALAQNIYDRYHGGSNDDLPNWFVHWSRGLQSPFNLGNQEKNRDLFVFNLLFRVRER
jgi:hypothetical protein